MTDKEKLAEEWALEWRIDSYKEIGCRPIYLSLDVQEDIQYRLRRVFLGGYDQGAKAKQDLIWKQALISKDLNERLVLMEVRRIVFGDDDPIWKELDARAKEVLG